MYIIYIYMYTYIYIFKECLGIANSSRDFQRFSEQKITVCFEVGRLSLRITWSLDLQVHVANTRGRAAQISLCFVKGTRWWMHL